MISQTKYGGFWGGADKKILLGFFSLYLDTVLCYLLKKPESIHTYKHIRIYKYTYVCVCEKAFVYMCVCVN